MDDCIYQELVKRASGMLKVYATTALDAEGLIAETFLRYGNIPKDEFAKKMYEIAGKNTENNYHKHENKAVIEQRRCKKCGEIKEAGWFRTWFLRGYLIHDSYCRPCKNKIASISKKKRRHINKYKTETV